MADTSPVITRFAPSPTGHLHIGGARTALFCWALAQRARRDGRDGRFLLRIEDTDAKRSSEAAARGILEDLAWLGIGWDEGPVLERADARGSEGSGPGVVFGGDPRGVGPFFQAQRLEIYNRYVDRLIAEGKAYPAFESPEELEASRRASAAEQKTYRYDRQEWNFALDEARARMENEEHVVRLRTPDEPLVVRDEVLGEIAFTSEHWDDFVIRKRDGFPTYHFAVVVDDELMGVTHVVRGQEHLNNTPKHVLLQRALGFRTPAYAHIPLVFNIDGTKMSKRDKDKAARAAARERYTSDADLPASPAEGVGLEEFRAWMGDKTRQLGRDALASFARKLEIALPEIDVEDFRAAGYLPGVLCNYISLLGWNPGLKNEDGTDLERWDNAFLAEHFTLDRVGKTNARFDREKLLSFNMQTLTGMEPEAFVRELRRWAAEFDPRLTAGLPEERFELLARAVQPQSKTLREAAERCRFAVIGAGEVLYDEQAVKKWLLKGEPSGVAVLGEFRGVLEGMGESEWTPERLHAAVQGFCEAKGLGLGKVAQPLRVALTGTAVSPSIDATLAAVGRAEALERIGRCVSAHS